MQSEYDYFNLSFAVRLSSPALSSRGFVILYCYLSKDFFLFEGTYNFGYRKNEFRLVWLHEMEAL